MRIAELRMERGMTQVQLAKALGVGQPAVCMWETGRAMPRAFMLRKIAKLLGCTVDDLIKDEDEEE